MLITWPFSVKTQTVAYDGRVDDVGEVEHHPNVRVGPIDLDGTETTSILT